jgi:putative ABC transport system permease protein
MLKSYIKLAFRNIYKNKIYSLINIIGLAIGLASSFIILIYVVNELSYDKYNKKLDDMYIVTTTYKDFNSTTPWTPYILGPSLKNQYPQVSEFARWASFGTIVKYKDKSFVKTRCEYADPSIFNILTLPLEEGSSRELLDNENTAIISRETADKYFVNTDPVGKILTVHNPGGTYDVKIAGIMKNIPRTSTFGADIIMPLSLLKDAFNKNWGKVEKQPLESRTLCIVNLYLLLNKDSNAGEFDKQLKNVSENYSDKDWKLGFHLFPVKDIYFHSVDMDNSAYPTGNISNVYIYAVIGFLILLVACINVIILNTGRASTRAKEIGVRKVAGAGRFNLIRQLLVESSMYAFLSLPLALLSVEIFLPALSRLLGKELPANYFHNWQFILIFVCVTFLVGMISGTYISVYLSKLSPIDIIKNNISIGSRKAVFRKIMIAFQMVIFIGLIIAFITISRQMSYFHNKDFGFDKNDLVVLDANNANFISNYEAFKDELKTNPDILGVTAGLLIPGTESSSTFLVKNQIDPSKKIPVEGYSVDKDFFEVMKMKILQGKSFAGLTPGEFKNTCIINESAMNKLGIKNPIGNTIENRTIIGVVKNFNMHSLRSSISPIAFTVNKEYINEVAVRVRPDNISKTIKFIQQKSKAFNNGKALEYDFFDQRIAALYGDEQKFDEMMGYFTGLAIFIACLGLFGMSLFVTRQRVKEIGIRKVMGASTANIFYTLTKEFLVLTIISTIIAAPFAVYLINKWLQNFAYRVQITYAVFIIAMVITILIILLTVGFQAIRAARANPVEALRYE